MIQKLKNILITFSTIFLVAAPAALVPVAVYADAATTSGLCQGAALTSDPNATNSCDSTQNAPSTLGNLAAKIINIFSIIVGVVSVIMIIVGGFRYVTSGGESGSVSSAKNTIIYAIIGLVVVAMAQFIVKFVLSKLATTPGIGQ